MQTDCLVPRSIFRGLLYAAAIDAVLALAVIALVALKGMR